MSGSEVDKAKASKIFVITYSIVFIPFIVFLISQVIMNFTENPSELVRLISNISGTLGYFFLSLSFFVSGYVSFKYGYEVDKWTGLRNISSKGNFPYLYVITGILFLCAPIYFLFF